MLEFYSYNKISGMIRNSGFLSPGFSPDIPSTEKIVLGKRASTDYYHNIETDTLMARPILINDESISLLVNQEYSPENIPAGTIVYVDGEDVGVVDNTGLTLVFPVAKQYTVKLVPPFPYFEKSITVEVI